eukprot:m.18732 g.18732  ORF g.18732 m.18732 type:complete len:84 (-) comp8353_c0_seq1:91-342(-)
MGKGESSEVVGVSKRKACWNARDEYYKCVAVNGVKNCNEAKEAFDKLCPKAWVEHFEKMNTYAKYKQKLRTEGYKLKDENKDN